MHDSPMRVREIDSGVEIALHVLPRAKRSEISGLYDGAIRLKISAPPVDDAANRAIVEFFAALLQLPKSRLRIVSGIKSRDKVLRIESMSVRDFSRHLPLLEPKSGL
jgi:uncharacterized protein (TIGR00251 family)